MAIISGNPAVDFGEQNPKLLTIKDFKTVYTKYPKDASRILWASYFFICLTDSSNPYSKIHNAEERLEAIKDDYYPDFDIEMYKHEIGLIEKFTMDKSEYLFNIHIIQLEALTAHYKSLSMSDPLQRKEYLDIAKTVPSLWKDYERLQKIFNDGKKKKKDNVLGGSELSGSSKIFD